MVSTFAPVLVVVYAIVGNYPKAALDCDPKVALESKVAAVLAAILPPAAGTNLAQYPLYGVGTKHNSHLYVYCCVCHFWRLIPRRHWIAILREPWNLRPPWHRWQFDPPAAGTNLAQYPLPGVRTNHNPHPYVYC